MIKLCSQNIVQLNCLPKNSVINFSSLNFNELQIQWDKYSFAIIINVYKTIQEYLQVHFLS